MKTIIYTNYSNNQNKVKDLILGILMITIAFSGLFMGSKLILKLIMYIIPIIVLIYAIKPYKMAGYFFKKDVKKFIIFLLQAIFLTIGALCVILFPIESLNYIVIIIGLLLLINSINNKVLYNSKISFFPFLLGTILILFSNSIINTFYNIFLLFILFSGISKITSYIYYQKK